MSFEVDETPVPWRDCCGEWESDGDLVWTCSEPRGHDGAHVARHVSFRYLQRSMWLYGYRYERKEWPSSPSGTAGPTR